MLLPEVEALRLRLGLLLVAHLLHLALAFLEHRIKLPPAAQVQFASHAVEVGAVHHLVYDALVERLVVPGRGANKHHMGPRRPDLRQRHSIQVLTLLHGFFHPLDDPPEIPRQVEVHIEFPLHALQGPNERLVGPRDAALDAECVFFQLSWIRSFHAILRPRPREEACMHGSPLGQSFRPSPRRQPVWRARHAPRCHPMLPPNSPLRAVPPSPSRG